MRGGPWGRQAVLGALCLAVLAGCGDSDGPDGGGRSFSATVDGSGWVPDTAIALVIGSATDTSLVIAAGRMVSPAEEQDLTVHLDGFRGAGTFALGDSGTAAYATFSRLLFSNGQLSGTQLFLTDLPAGSLRVTTFDRTDSMVAGTFAFEAATSPDTASHRLVTGQFRLRWRFQQVFTP